MAAALAAGCAGPSRKLVDIERGPWPVWVRAAADPTRSGFHGFAIGKGSGLAMGAAKGALEGLAEARPSGEFAGLDWLLSLVVGATVGAVVGAGAAVAPEQVDAAVAALDEGIAALSLSKTLAASLVELAPEHAGLEAGQLRLESAGSEAPSGLHRVEVAVTAVGFEDGLSAEPTVRLSLAARVRVLEVAAPGGVDRELDAGEFRYVSPVRPLADWLRHDARELTTGIRAAVEQIARDVADELFLATEFPYDSGLWVFPGRPGWGSCWFEPLEPRQRHRSMSGSLGDASPDRMLLWDTVPANPPTLRWEPFPRPRDAGDTRTARRIRDVRYDLMIWEAPDGVRGRLVYAVRGLPAPEHRLLHPLPHGRGFFWTFRARYRLDGSTRATPWAFSLLPSTGVGMPLGGTCEPTFIPDSNYFRFRTR